MIRFVKTPDLDNRFDTTKIEISADNDVCLTEALDMAEAFLRAVGYQFDGNLVIRSDEEDEEEGILYRKIAELEDKLASLKVSPKDAVIDNNSKTAGNDACSHCVLGGCCE
jgi:hypothetical protein